MIRVLVVDDDPNVRFTARAALEGAPPPEGLPMSVVEVASGEEALRVVATERFDVIVLDIMMPGLDGLAVLESIRRHDGGQLAVIMLTARGRESDVAEAYRLGADAYLTKPFDVDELAEVVSVMAQTPAADRIKGRQRELERAELLLQLETRFGDLPLDG
jgi:CheY-like chemotaxis protein